MGFIIIYVTHESQSEAEQVAKDLLDKRLIACANIFPIKSFYLWEGKTEKSSEFVSILKTKTKNYNKVKEEIMRVQSVGISCIMKINVSANTDYEKWINKETV